MEKFTINNNYLPLIKILTVNDISLACDRTIKSHLLVIDNSYNLHNLDNLHNSYNLHNPYNLYNS